MGRADEFSDPAGITNLYWRGRSAGRGRRCCARRRAHPPWLVSWAAAGLMGVMIGATILHTRRGEVSSAIITAVLFVVTTFVAYMRWKVLPIRP